MPDRAPHTWPGIPRATRAVWATLAASSLLVVAVTGQPEARSLAVIPWLQLTTVLVLLALSASHVLFAVWGLRAATGRHLALRPTIMAQLAAAATNRIVPNGIAGAAVNLRYLFRNGISAGAAASALAALAVVAGLTDLAVVGGVTAVGPHVGLTGAAQEMAALAARGLAAGQQNSGALIAVMAALGVVALYRCRRVRISVLITGVTDALGHLRDLGRDPARLIAALLASTGSTLVMGIGFVLAVDAWGNSAATLPPGAVLTVYLVGTAVGGTAPVPAFFGLTEAALVAGLVLGGYSLASAVVTVAVFRALTYWLPLPIGLWAGRRLRRVQLI
jgi:uncharacterized membrane protein YbhN (UPF0104 family)